jgi:hypothetical protein
VLDAIVGGDSSFIGYINPGQGSSLRVSDSAAGTDDRAVFRFLGRGDSVPSGDSSLRFSSIDSLKLSISIQARDTSMKGLRMLFYQLPVRVDSTWTFDSVETQLIAANLIDSAVVADTDTTSVPRLTMTLRDTALNRLTFVGSDTGQRRVAIGLRVRANGHTAVRIGSVNAGSQAPGLVWYTHLATTDTTLQKRIVTRALAFNNFLIGTPVVRDPDRLAIGGVPSERTLIRFQLPAYLKDSVTLVRATLEMVPTAPYVGLPGDSVFLYITGILSDLGAKSPLTTPVRGAVLPLGVADTLRLDLVNLVKLWQGTTSLPNGIFLQLRPEGDSYTRAEYFSTRSPTGRPRLLVTYAQRYPFERP